MDQDQNLIRNLRNGKVSVIPTDTLYGIVASASKPEAVQQVYTLRHRTPSKPCIILISDLNQLGDLGIHPNSEQKEIISKYWPGPVSLILKTERSDLDYLDRGTGKLAVRLPASTQLRSLLDKTGPLIAPSANLEGKAPATTVKEAKSYFGDAVGMYVDEGKVDGKPSGLIDLTKQDPVIIRPL